MRYWLKVGAMSAALVALVVQAFREAVQSRPKS